MPPARAAFPGPILIGAQKVSKSEYVRSVGKNDERRATGFSKPVASVLAYPAGLKRTSNRSNDAV